LINSLEIFLFAFAIVQVDLAEADDKDGWNKCEKPLEDVSSPLLSARHGVEGGGGEKVPDENTSTRLSLAIGDQLAEPLIMCTTCLAKSLGLKWPGKKSIITSFEASPAE
jgi:hypothetical protein